MVQQACRADKRLCRRWCVRKTHASSSRIT